MAVLKYFFRHPDPLYFSLEKLFLAIGEQVSASQGSWLTVDKGFMPFASHWRKIAPNISYVRGHQGDINHITGDIHYAILGCSKKKVNIMTIHDCVILHRYPVWHPRHLILKWLWYDLPVKKADIVTVISEQTKKELLHFTRCDPGKIIVIPDFVDPAFQFSPYSFNSGLPRILFIGSTPNKNLDRLIMALAGLNVELEIVGSLSDEQKRLLGEQATIYRQSSRISDDMLLEKYRQCDLLAFPSTYEGFGLPILEAQATGRPVLTSKLSPMQDVAGDGACLVDPYDTASIREGLLALLGEEGLRNRLIDNGLKNVQRFRLQHVTDQYVNLYKDLLYYKSNNK